MIYFTPQLMPNDRAATLYMVTNPIPFKRYEDHEAAIYIQLYELVAQAIGSGENPIALIEDYLEINYNLGKSIEEISDFLIHTDKVQIALSLLKENWEAMDTSLPESSLLYEGGIKKQEALQLYSQITLRTYLETLVTRIDE